MNRFRSLIFPLALALILGGLSAWLGRISELIVEEVRLPTNEPQYSMYILEGKIYDDLGDIKEKLTASKAWQFPDKEDIYLSSPNLQLFSKNKIQYQVTGKIARYHLEDKKVFFQDNVVLNKEADEQYPEAEIKTEEMQIDTVNQFAQTNLLVHYRYGESYGTAKGMSYDHQSGILNLPSKVKALFYETDIR